MNFNALILAGSRGDVDPVATYAGVSDKALVEIDGRTMLARVMDALVMAGAVRIYVSASSDAVRAHAEALGAIALAAAPGPSASAAQAFAVAGAPLLVTTADHALLRPEWITAFLAGMPQADVVVMMARRSAIERDAPPSRRTYLRLADGEWSGCNLFWLATPAADRALRLWSQVERDRKRPWAIVRRMGLPLLVRYALGRLTLQQALDALGRKAGVKPGFVDSPSGLAAIDVDKPSDLHLVRKRLSADSAFAS